MCRSGGEGGLRERGKGVHLRYIFDIAALLSLYLFLHAFLLPFFVSHANIVGGIEICMERACG